MGSEGIIQNRRQEWYLISDLERALLVAAEFRDGHDVYEQLTELRQLVQTAGAQVVDTVRQKRTSPDRATFIGKGKLMDIVEYAHANDVDLLVFDHDLSPAQQRNIELVTDIRTIDRTQVILDIFAARAHSREGQLQVKLAQLEYLLPRLTGRGHELSRLAGGIGTRGPGETKLEVDRRVVRNRIAQLQREIDSLQQHRRLRRQNRRRKGLQTVALVGYTNAGKSTLLNALTMGGAIVEDKLFATLDPVTRRATGPSGLEFLLTDTVGFVSRLPHHLVAAFRATLEEVTEADLLVHVVDGSHRRCQEQKTEVERVLVSLGAANKPIIKAFNKSDRFQSIPTEVCTDKVYVSAATGTGTDKLLVEIERCLRKLKGRSRIKLTLDYEHSGYVARLHEIATVHEIKYGAEDIYVDVEADAAVIDQLSKLEGERGEA